MNQDPVQQVVEEESLTLKDELHEKALHQFIEDSFKSDYETQLSQLKTQFDSIKSDHIKQQVFWESFFQFFLEPCQHNVPKTQLLYDFLVQKFEQVDKKAFNFGFQKIFTENYIYDLIESGPGKSLYAKIFEPFFLQKASAALSTIHFDSLKEGEVFGELKTFFKAVAAIIKKEHQLDEESSTILTSFLKTHFHFQETELND